MDSFLHNHQSALDSQREDDAIQYLQDTGVYPTPDEDCKMNLEQIYELLVDFVEKEEKLQRNWPCNAEYCDVPTWNTVYDALKILDSIIDYEPTDLEMQQSFGTAWHDWI